MRNFKEFSLKHLISLLFSIIGSQIILFSVIGRLSIIYFVTLPFIVLGYYFIFNKVTSLKYKGKYLYITTIFIVFFISAFLGLIGNKIYYMDYFYWFLNYTSNTKNLFLYEFISLILLPFIFSSFVYCYSIRIFRLFMLFLISFIPRIIYINLADFNFDIINYIFIFLLLLMYIEKNLNNKNRKHSKEYIHYKLILIFGSTLVGVIFLIAFILPNPTTLPNLSFINLDNTFVLAEQKSVIINKDFHEDNNKLLFSFTGYNPHYLIEKHYNTYTNNTWVTTSLPFKPSLPKSEATITNEMLWYISILNNATSYTTGYFESSVTDKVLNLKVHNIYSNSLPHPPNVRYIFPQKSNISFKKDIYDEIEPIARNYFDKNSEFEVFFDSNDLDQNAIEDYNMKEFTLASFKELVNTVTTSIKLTEKEDSFFHNDPTFPYYDDNFFKYISSYLEYPDVLSSEVINLTKEITKGNTSYYSSAKLIEMYLKSDKFTYSLDLPEQKGSGDYINYFILEGKTGYCVQYATAMTLMCRNIGIPARYVTGYLIDDDNLKNGTYLVSYEDSHAFVEVYLPGYGWKIFDPTPAAPNTTKPNILSPTVTVIDKTVQEKTFSQGYIFTIIIILIFILIFIAFAILGKYIYKLYMHITKRPRFLKRVKKLNAGEALESLIKNSIYLLQLSGITPAPGETLLEFSGRVNEKIEVDFTKLVEVYYKYKYADEIVENGIIEKAFSVNSKIHEFSKINTKKQPYKKAITKNL